jgi:hypothetical protein
LVPGWTAASSRSGNDQKFSAKNAEKSPIIGPAKKGSNSTRYGLLIHQNIYIILNYYFSVD